MKDQKQNHGSKRTVDLSTRAASEFEEVRRRRMHEDLRRERDREVEQAGFSFIEKGWRVTERRKR